MAILNYLGHAVWNTLTISCIGLLPLIVIALIMQICSNSIRKSLASVLGIKGYVYLTAPGVMVHELGHALFCLIFRHKIVEMKLFSPEADGTLGYVNHQYNPKSFYQRAGNFFIGTGPVWLGTAVIVLLSLLLLPSSMLQFSGETAECISAFLGGIFSLSLWSSWQTWLWLYLILTISSHITLSPPDLRGASGGIGTIVLLVFLLNLSLGWCCDLPALLQGAILGVYSLYFPIITGTLILSFALAFLLSAVSHRRH